MTKARKNKKIMNVNLLKLIGLLSLMLLLCISCGGGGGENTPSISPDSAGITYTGKSSRVVIDENNAEEIATSAYSGGNLGVAIGGRSAVQAPANQNAGLTLLNVSQILLDLYNQAPLNAGYAGTLVHATHSEKDTLQGECGGSATINIAVDDQTGAFSGSINFNSYCNAEVTINGNVDYSGAFSDTEASFTMSFNKLKATNGNESMTMKGDISFDSSDSSAVMTMNMLLQDNGSNKVYEVDDYRIAITDSSNSSEFTASGNYYDPDYGYVIISTSEAFVIYYGDSYPSDGVMVFTGAKGSAGGNTAARLTALSSTTCQVEADTDGDGFYEWNSGVLYWENLL